MTTQPPLLSRAILQTLWTKRFPEGMAEEFESRLRSCTFGFKILTEILEEIEAGIVAKDLSETNLDQNNYAQRKAFYQGQLNTIKKIKRLMEFDSK